MARGCNINSNKEGGVSRQGASMKTDAERKRLERERKLQAGLRPFELWLTDSEHLAVKAFLIQLRSTAHAPPE